MLKVQITTAIELSDKQVATIEQALHKKFAPQELVVEYQVDSHVLGGIKVIVGSREFDATLRARLDQVHHQLTQQQ